VLSNAEGVLLDLRRFLSGGVCRPLDVVSNGLKCLLRLRDSLVLREALVEPALRTLEAGDEMAEGGLLVALKSIGVSSESQKEIGERGCTQSVGLSMLEPPV
jgi:hypothetical protein